jgi:hypothetical protein
VTTADELAALRAVREQLAALRETLSAIAEPLSSLEPALGDDLTQALVNFAGVAYQFNAAAQTLRVRLATRGASGR